MTKPEHDPYFKQLVRGFLQTNTRMTYKQAAERAKSIILQRRDRSHRKDAALQL